MTVHTIPTPSTVHSLERQEAFRRDASRDREAQRLATQAIDDLRRVSPEVAPVFETAQAKALIVEQYRNILDSGEVRFEGRL